MAQNDYFKWKELDNITESSEADERQALEEEKKNRKKKKGLGWFQTFSNPEDSVKFFNHVMGADKNDSTEASSEGAESITEDEKLFAVYLKVVNPKTGDIIKDKHVVQRGSKADCEKAKKELEEVSPEDSYHNRNIYTVGEFDESKVKYLKSSLEEDYERISKEDEAWLDKKIEEHNYKVVSKRDYGWFEEKNDVHYQIISNEGNKTADDLDKAADWLDSLLDEFEDLCGSPCTYNIGLQTDGYISAGFDCRAIYYKPGEDTFHKSGTKWRFKNGKPADTATAADMKATGDVLGIDITPEMLPLDKLKKESIDIKDKTFKCCLCGKECTGYGNNPEPLAKEGRCCDKCNSTKVIPARLDKLGYILNYEDGDELDEVWTNGSGPGYYENIDYIKRDLEEAEIKFIENSFDGNTYIEVSEEDGQKADEIICNWVGENYTRNQGKGELGDQSFEFIIENKYLYDESLKESEDISGEGDWRIKIDNLLLKDMETDKTMKFKTKEDALDWLEFLDYEHEFDESGDKALVFNYKTKEKEEIDLKSLHNSLKEDIKRTGPWKVIIEGPIPNLRDDEFENNQSFESKEQALDFIKGLIEVSKLLDTISSTLKAEDGEETNNNSTIIPFKAFIINKDTGEKEEVDLDALYKSLDESVNEGAPIVAGKPAGKGDIIGWKQEFVETKEVEATDEYRIAKGNLISTPIIYGAKKKPKSEPKYAVYFAKYVDAPGNRIVNSHKYKEHDIYFDTLEKAQACVKDYGKTLKSDLDEDIKPTYKIWFKDKEEFLSDPITFDDITFDSEEDAVKYIEENELENAEVSYSNIDKVKVDRLGGLAGLDEDIEKHDELNPALFDGEELKPEVKEKVIEIVDTFIKELREDDIKFNLKDIILVGSNVSYNYTRDSDLDIHIIADSNGLECPAELYSLLYGAYRSIFNKNYDINIKDIPVEIFVEIDENKGISNGVYSINNGWVKKPEKQKIPEIDKAAFDAEFKKWEDRYLKFINNSVDSSDEISNNDIEDDNMTLTEEVKTEPSEEQIKDCEEFITGYLFDFEDDVDTLSMKASLKSEDSLVKDDLNGMKAFVTAALRLAKKNSNIFVFKNSTDHDILIMKTNCSRGEAFAKAGLRGHYTLIDPIEYLGEDLRESFEKDSYIELEYKDLPITISHITKPETYDSSIGGTGGWSPAESEDSDEVVDYTLEVSKDEVKEALYNELADAEEFKDYSDEELKNYIDITFDELVEDHNEFIKNYFKDKAIEYAKEEYWREH